MEAVVTAPAPSFWTGKRVLLTGHTGFKGAWCAVWLRELGADVQGLALVPENNPSLWTLLGEPGGGGSLGDVRSPGVAERFIVSFRPEIVIHMAAQALVQPSYVDPAATFATNVMGLVHVLDAARRCDVVKAVVNVTSDKCYENREQLWAYREDEPMGGSDPYSASKGCAELITASYRRSFFNVEGGARLASARAGNVIGGGDWSQDRLIPDCIRSFRAGEPVSLRNPLATRPWQHVLEPLSGYLVLAQALYEQGAEVAEGWNFGPSDEDAWPVGRVADRVAELWGPGAEWRQDAAAWPKEATLLRVDAAKARARLGWRPRLNIDEALQWTVEWFQALAEGCSAETVTRDQIARYTKRASASPQVTT